MRGENEAASNDTVPVPVSIIKSILGIATIIVGGFLGGLGGKHYTDADISYRLDNLETNHAKDTAAITQTTERLHRKANDAEARLTALDTGITVLIKEYEYLRDRGIDHSKLFESHEEKQYRLNDQFRLRLRALENGKTRR